MKIQLPQKIILILSALACAAMLWAYQDRVTNFEASHRTASQATTAEIANQISFILQERQRQVRLFAEDHLMLLRKLQSTPEDDTTHNTIERALKRALPDFFAFTIANSKGEPLIDDFDGLVGDVCVQDIKLFSKNNHHSARIHPNNLRYHFDIIAKWSDSNGLSNMLMVSFDPSELGHLLKAVQQSGHQLMLITDSDPPLLEVTTLGGRDKTPREDYRLSSTELERLLASHSVQFSRWKIADFQQPGFFSQYRRSALVYFGLFFLIFAVVIGIAFIILQKEERRRITAELAREELVSMITHEMRTPVTAISGTLTFISSGVIKGLPEAMKNSIDLLERNAERLRRLIDDLLESRRIDSEQFSLQKIPMNLQQVVSESILHLRDYVSQLDVSIELDEVEERLWVNADPVRIQQIMSNLISNAAKFSTPGGLVQVAVIKINSSTARVSVRDYGQGIPVAFQPNIFQKFARGPTPQNRQVVSTGLGLSIVKSLLEAHEGTIEFVSEENQGTTFHFDLPLIQNPSL